MLFRRDEVFLPHHIELDMGNLQINEGAQESGKLVNARLCHEKFRQELHIEKPSIAGELFVEFGDGFQDSRGSRDIAAIDGRHASIRQWLPCHTSVRGSPHVLSS